MTKLNLETELTIAQLDSCFDVILKQRQRYYDNHKKQYGSNQIMQDEINSLTKLKNEILSIPSQQESNKK